MCMTVKLAQKILTRQRRKAVTKKKNLDEDAVWDAMCGMWKDSPIDPIKYQQQMRKESDHIRL